MMQLNHLKTIAFFPFKNAGRDAGQENAGHIIISSDFSEKCKIKDKRFDDVVNEVS